MPTRIVIVGGGFAGLNAARELGASGSTQMEITLVDRRNHHLFQPLLYQVAMAGLSPADISTPIRSELRSHEGTTVRLGTVVDVDTDAKIVHLEDGQELPFDYLVLACGATHSYFGNDHWEQHAPGLKSVEEATEIRRRILTAFERAEVEPDAAVRRALLTFVVVGGGPTGVELAGALGELSRHTLERDFRNIEPSATRVILVEGGPRILASFDEELSAESARELEKLGVTIWTDTMVTDIDAHGVTAGNERIQAETVLWAAGVKASELNERLPGERDRAGRISVSPDLSLPGHPNIFVIGDQSQCKDKEGIVPGVAPAAIQQGLATAQNILADLRGNTRSEFEYFDKGMMATIGRAKAVVQSGGLRTVGFIAWLAWCFVHILYLVGFRNRLLVFIQWTWSYVRYKRGARLITGRNWQQPALEEPLNTAKKDAV